MALQSIACASNGIALSCTERDVRLLEAGEGNRDQNVSADGTKEPKASEGLHNRTLFLAGHDDTEMKELSVQEQRLIPRLIGPKGEVIKGMSNKSGAEIKFAQRYCILSGSEKARKSAWELVQNKIQELDRDFETRQLPFAGLIGLLVGEKGIVIKRMSEESQARINYSVENNSCTTYGTIVQRQSAWRLILDFCDGLSIISLSDLRQDPNRPSRTLLGLLIGRKGTHIKAIESASGARLHISKKTLCCIIGGDDASRIHANGLLRARISSIFEHHFSARRSSSNNPAVFMSHLPLAAEYLTRKESGERYWERQRALRQNAGADRTRRARAGRRRGLRDCVALASATPRERVRARPKLISSEDYYDYSS